MAHFAQLDENNIVTQVIVVSNEELLDNGVESEMKGIEFCKSLFGENTKWVQTSYNGKIRKQYAGIGFAYDLNKNAFVAPQPYPSWTLNADYRWQAPVTMPVEEGKFFKWDEPTLAWVEVEIPA
jgi:hypothetical protein